MNAIERGQYIGVVMTNFDHSIDRDLEQQLRKNPNVVYANHTAWEFCGGVYFNGEKFVEEVMRHRVTVGTYEAETLEELMDEVNRNHGNE